MAHRKNAEDTESISLRISADISKEFDVIAEAIPFAKKASIIKECLKIGLEELKKQRPDIMKLVEQYQKNHPSKSHHEPIAAKGGSRR